MRHTVSVILLVGFIKESVFRALKHYWLQNVWNEDVEGAPQAAPYLRLMV